MARKSKIQKCRICGCIDDDCSGCIERTGRPCDWVKPNLCSACVPTPRHLRINTIQLAALRGVNMKDKPKGRIWCDGSTGKALVARRYAMYIDGQYFITHLGIGRSVAAADILVNKDGVREDPSLMQDL